MSIQVIGISRHCTLSDDARTAVRSAQLLVGSAVNLQLAGAPAGAERIELGPLAPALDRLRGSAGKAVVLASGDPGFFGIVRSMREAGLDFEVLPAVSSVAAAFAAAGLPWDGAIVVSAHGRELGPALNACRAFPSVAVLTGPGAGPVELARGLAGWPRELVVLERLGLPDQRLSRLAADQVADLEPAQFTDPNVLLSLDPSAVAKLRKDNQPAAPPSAGWALPEAAYQHRDSMITKAEVRAYLVARLRPRLGRLVLDIGAGSGSVGIECALLGAAAVCVERDPQACRMIGQNAQRHGVGVRIVEGSAPQALTGLPDPDAVFIGGGGLEVVQAIAGRRIPLVVAAFAALDRTVAAHGLLSAAGYRVEGSQLSASRLADLPGGSLRLAASNPTIVLTAELT